MSENHSQPASAPPSPQHDSIELSQRPTRKASKKALEELSRETQRMHRNMQLTHQARTKKKFTTKELLAKFNFRQPFDVPPIAVTKPNPPESFSIQNQHDKDTPPTSPARHDEEIEKQPGNHSYQDLPSIQDILRRPVRRLDKGKAKATDQDLSDQKISPRHFSSNTPLPSGDPDSDDDLEIIKPSSRFPVFDRIPAQKAKEPHSLLTLRALAHLTSPSKSKPKNKASMNPAQLQAFLRRRAREQARIEREEKLNELRARGIIIQTEEEREKDQLELESLLEKARLEAQELAIKEKEAAKRGNNDNANDGLEDSDEDDEEWCEGDEENDAELSPSEDEDLEDEDMEEPNGLVDRDADEDDGESVNYDGGTEADTELSEVEDDTPRLLYPPRAKRRHVIDDDDDDGEESGGQSLMAASNLSPSARPSSPTAGPSDNMDAFGFAPAAHLSLSQAFAGTMANTFTTKDTQKPAADDEPDSLDFLRQLPPATAPEFDTMLDESQDFFIQDSQTGATQAQKQDSQPFSETPGIHLPLSQFITEGTINGTQASEMPDPTQDVGFTNSRTPGRQLAPPSTVDTEIILAPESPTISKTGRLRRKDVIPLLSDVDEDAEYNPLSDEDNDVSSNAFAIMKQAVKKPRVVDTFDKTKSKAKEMVVDQAEESEDEYAGLGGASDDEINDEVDEEVQNMMDDGEIEVDERKIAAFFADKARKEDEKQMDKLYKDIVSGALRRKRGEAFDLSDSDDNGEQRRRRKQREFARMRKALLEDEKIGKIAEDPKKQAFFRAIEDREDNDDLDFLNAPDDTPESVPDSQVDSQNKSSSRSTPPPTAPDNPFKRRRTEVDEHDENRPAVPHNRRTLPSHSKKPATLAEIRQSLSFLIEEPTVIPESQLSDPGSDLEIENQPSQNADPGRICSTRLPIVDRVALARTSSITNSNGDDSDAHLVFRAPSSGSHVPGFKFPSLLRRVTAGASTTSISTSTSSSGASTPLSESGTSVRRGGSKKSNIHYQAREAERRAILEVTEKRRKADVRKRAADAGRNNVLGVLNGNIGFE